MQQKLSQKQIPTLLGIGILLVSLIAGIFLIGSSSVFAPRATPQTTPKNMKITNVKDNSFTVSFLTDEATSGFVKFGTSPTELKTQAGDERDLASGSVGQFTTHYISARELEPDTTYYFTLGTGSVSRYDNEGTPFTIRTAKRGGTPTAAKTIYGNVASGNNAPVEGSIVYVSMKNAGDQSALVKSTNSWAIPLSGARTKDGSNYAQINNTDTLAVTVQGLQVGQVESLETTVEEAQPLKTITIGGTGTSSIQSTQATSTQERSVTSDRATANTRDESEEEEETTGTSSSSSQTFSNPTPTPTTQPLSQTMSTDQNASSSSSSAIVTQKVDVNVTDHQVVDTTQPEIIGKVAPDVTVTIQVHSETEITSQVRTDSAGNFVLDLETLEKQLEPGEHTVTISYTDPATKKIKTETRTFTVTAKTEGVTKTTSSDLLAQANTTPKPYGSGNPYTIPTPTPTTTPSATPKVTPTVTSSTSTTTTRPRVALPATTSGVPKSGSVTTTLALLFTGMFFIVAGSWSYFQAAQVRNAEDDLSAEDLSA